MFLEKKATKFILANDGNIFNDMCSIGLNGNICMQNSSSGLRKQKYFEDKNNEEESREEHNNVEFKYFIKWKIMMMKLFSLSTDRTPAMFGSIVSWLIIINKQSEKK